MVTPTPDTEPDTVGQEPLYRLSKLAQEDPARKFSSIAHLLTPQALREAFASLSRQASAGVDAVTYCDYEGQAHQNIHKLWERLREGTYRVQPLRRIYIPKEDGKQRAISIPALEDKIVQKATVRLLNAIFEPDFLDCSYGARPDRNAHQALDEVGRLVFCQSITHVLELDIVSYFDAIVRGALMEMIEQRISDRSLLRLIGKWINVGVLDQGRLLCSETGIGQGQVISPFLANVYLHNVLDKWFEDVVKPRLRGQAFLVRYMDDAVICFQNDQDAQKVLKVLVRRMEKYGLTLHPSKTRLIEFGRRALLKARKLGSKPKTFDFLGFTHISAWSRRGHYTTRVRTMRKRLRRSLRDVAQWCKANRHRHVREQQAVLSSKLRGHYQYYGRSSNYQCLRQFYQAVCSIWRKWLGRRSRADRLSLATFSRFLKRHPLLLPRITHSWASWRSPI
jgi:group II intron reverse transcriptase/maturase